MTLILPASADTRSSSRAAAFNSEIYSPPGRNCDPEDYSSTARKCRMDVKYRSFQGARMSKFYVIILRHKIYQRWNEDSCL